MKIFKLNYLKLKIQSKNHLIMEFFHLILYIIIQYFIKINAQQNVDEIEKLPGANFPLNFKQYSGFLQVSAIHFYHYWFFESQNAPETDPLIIEVPASSAGCSSMQSLSMLFPFYTNSDGKTLRPNPYGLNNNASVLVIDGPAGVGFSYTTDGNYTSNDDLTIDEFYDALKQFFVKFPEFRNHRVFLDGHTYAGVYAPLLAAKILANFSDYPIDIKGIIIGNGIVQNRIGIPTSVELAYYHGMVDEKWWAMIQRECCNEGSDICWNGTMEKEWKVLADNETCGLKVWNAYSDLRKSMDIFDISLICENDNKTGETDSFANNSTFIPLDICNNAEYKTAYFNREKVQKALHIPSTNNAYSFVPTNGSTVVWESCRNEKIDYGYGRIDDDMANQFKAILDAKLRVLLFYGDQDMYANFLHGQRMPERMGLELTTAKKPWKFVEQVAGFNTTYADGKFTILTVRFAGNYVKGSRPDLTDYIISKFLQD